MQVQAVLIFLWRKNNLFTLNSNEMKNKTSFLTIVSLGFTLLFSFVATGNAQTNTPVEKTTKDKSFVKAAYFDINRSIIFPGVGGGVTLVNRNNIIFSVRHRAGSIDSPHKPSNFRPYRSNTGSSGSGGGLIYIPVYVPPGFSSGGGGSPPTNECKIGCKDYKITSFLVGKMIYNSGIHTRVSIESGLTFLSIDEAVDFVYVPSRGHSFSQDKYFKVGASFRAGVEFPFSKCVGLSSKLDFTLAEGEYLFGLEFGLIVGFLRR
jgi:hypothetical protein